MGDLTRNFSRSEFACKGKNCCGGSTPVQPALATGLQEIRDKIGKPLTISSGFRCKTHNRAIGGAENSQHCLGTAVDLLCPDDWTPAQLAGLAETIPVFEQGGIGIYKSWVHLDIRQERARWQK